MPRDFREKPVTDNDTIFTLLELECGVGREVVKTEYQKLCQYYVSLGKLMEIKPTLSNISKKIADRIDGAYDDYMNAMTINIRTQSKITEQIL
ncbi:MAG: hypothetical protein HOM96_04620 [Rickettsiales bacterium]|jgi:hypothetical protein|nr:hypothetical protein [Rickettsiales bacterium]